MKINRINNTSEIITFNEVSTELQNSGYFIFPKLPISDVINSSTKHSLSKQEKNLFKKSHFDFVVTDKNHIPVFAIEFDGPCHLKEDVKLRDIRKNRICQVAEFPLLRITDAELEKVDSISIVRFIIYRFVKWSQNHGTIKRKLEDELSKLSDEEYQSVVSDSFIDVGYNPDYIFHIEHPFPLKESVVKELEEKYQLDSRPSETRYWYSVNRYGYKSSNGFHTASYTYGIYKGKGTNSSISFINGKLETKGIEILLENKVNYVMRYALVTVANLNHKINPIQYKSTYGILPIYYSEIPGATIPNICESIAEYVCYKKVLTWIRQNT